MVDPSPEEQNVSADDNPTMNVRPGREPAPDRARAPRSQRDMVIASLLRCPDRDRNPRSSTSQGW
jgi:hypothetical protein